MELAVGISLVETSYGKEKQKGTGRLHAVLTFIKSGSKAQDVAVFRSEWALHDLQYILLPSNVLQDIPPIVPAPKSKQTGISLASKLKLGFNNADDSFALKLFHFLLS